MSPESDCGLEEFKILIVDDDAISRFLLEHFLKKIGCFFRSASNGLEALNLLKTMSFDLIFMDIRMPVMDGIEATQNIRGGTVGMAAVTIPIIAVTSEDIHDHDARHFGMNGIIRKPFGLETIEKLISYYKTKKEGSKKTIDFHTYNSLNQIPPIINPQ